VNSESRGELKVDVWIPGSSPRPFGLWRTPRND
jgi:hypothetical protein